MSLSIWVASGCFAIGFASMWLLRLMVRKSRLRVATQEGQDIIENAEWNAKSLLEETKKRAEDQSEDAHRELDSELNKVRQKMNDTREQISDREAQLEHDIKKVQKAYNKQKQGLDNYQKKVDRRRDVYQAKKDVKKRTYDQWVEALLEKAGESREDLVKSLESQVIEEAHVGSQKMAQEIEEEFHELSERKAKRILNTVINRFARPYCPERGVGYLNFANEKQRDKVLGAEQINLRNVEKACGVDLIFNEENNAVNVSGFDPVRREWARLVVDRLMSERRVDDRVVEKVISRCKNELFKRIRRDGNRLAKELGLENLDSEIRDMMGALRYRYSFTQNQHFHCAEVGWLCGLLSSELKVEIKDGRRAGMLHDIGKAMDHSVEGGHAVIGADFIEKNGEAEHIVHAVRAHHYDETPSTDLAHLVIAADAISGARPGARRSTVTTYKQKMEDLHSIAQSFDGVTDTHILSAGREVRVTVNGQSIDDWRALELSKSIAKKIETECSYPGQIKVTVVRETQAVEFAK